MAKNQVSKFLKMNSLERIRHSFENDEYELSPTDETLKNRYRKAHSLLLNQYSPSQTAKELMNEYGVSQATAYRDVKNSTIILGSVADVDVKGMKVQLRESYWMLYQRCLKKDDLDGARKNLDSYRALMDSEIDQLFDLERLEPHEYHMIMPEEMKPLLESSLLSGKGIVLNFDPEDVLDVDFKEIYNTEEEDGSTEEY